MECPDCEGKGFKEYDAGIVQIGCKTCESTGKVDCELTKEEFEKAYAFRSDMTPDQVAELGLVAVQSEGTEGWAMQKVEIARDTLEVEPETFTLPGEWEVANEKARLELEAKQTEEGKEAVRQQRLDNIESRAEAEAVAQEVRATRPLKPNEYRCSKCSKPGKTVIHMLKKDGKGIGTKHLEFKV